MLIIPSCLWFFQKNETQGGLKNDVRCVWGAGRMIARGGKRPGARAFRGCRPGRSRVVKSATRCATRTPPSFLSEGADGKRIRAGTAGFSVFHRRKITGPPVAIRFVLFRCVAGLGGGMGGR